MAGIEQWFQFESKDDKEANRKSIFRKCFLMGKNRKQQMKKC